MSMTTVEISEETRKRKLLSGISYTKLIELGLEFVENRQNSNQDLAKMEKNIANFSAIIRTLNNKIYDLEAKNGIFQKEWNGKNGY